MPSDPPSDRRLRVVVVSHAYNEPGRLDPFAALGKHVDLTLVRPRDGSSETSATLSRTVDEHLLDVVDLPAIHFGRMQFVMRGLGKTLRSRRPELVCVEYDAWHVQFLQVAIILAVTRSRARIVLVVKKNTYRAPTSLLGRGKRLLAQWGIRRASSIIAASEMTRELYIRELGAKASSTVVQPHLPVDVSRFQPRERPFGQRPLRIGFVGKIGSAKGVPELVDAFEQVRRRSEVPIELWLAGRITDDATGELISAAENVHHAGVINNHDLHEFLDNIDVFVMPARILPDHQEHDGRAVLEAMSTGIPCVVSDSGILPELVSPAEGRVFPSKNTRSLANCLEELVASEELRRDLGSRARQRAVATVSPDVLSAERVSIFNRTMEVAQ